MNYAICFLTFLFFLSWNITACQNNVSRDMFSGCSDLRKKDENVCIPAQSMLEEFLEIHYIVKRKMNEQNLKKNTNE